MFNFPPKFRPVEQLISAYGESHQHPLNENIHLICVPAIALSLLGMLHAWIPIAAWATVLAGLSYYFFLSKPYFLGAVLTIVLPLLLIIQIPAKWLWWLSLLVFIAAWAGQFYGHKIEGKKPSFFQDLTFLAIGPLFVMNVLAKRLNLNFFNTRQ